MTIHNLAFQGKFRREILAGLGLPAHAWSLEGVEYYGGSASSRAACTSPTRSPR